MRTPMLWSESILSSLTPHNTLSSSQQEPVSPSSADVLPPRQMHESYSELVLPFSTSKDLLEGYINAAGGIRTGKLMEHLDSLAGSISYKHLLGPGIETLGSIDERGFYVVTAAVDRLDMLAPLLPVRDLRLSGQVIHTGQSSMEIAVKMEAVGSNGQEETIMLGELIVWLYA